MRLAWVTLVLSVGPAITAPLGAQEDAGPIDHVVAVVGNSIILFSQVQEEVLSQRMQGVQLPTSADSMKQLQASVLSDLIDAQLPGQLEHEPTALITSIIHDHGNWGGEAKSGDLLKEFTHTGGVDVAVIGHGDELMGDGMQGPQHIETLPATGSAHHDADETP